MSDAVQFKKTTLGYHRPGDFYSHVLLPKLVYNFGSVGDAITTTDEMAALIVSVHEHFHIMQEMLQGYSWWRQSTLDELASHVSRLLQKQPPSGVLPYPLWHKPTPLPTALALDERDSADCAKKAILQLERCDQLLSYPELTRMLIEAELQGTPELAKFLNDDCFLLTTLDLFECQAAILTQFFIELRLTEMPTRFSRRAAEEVAGLYQIDNMPDTYNRPLRILAHVFDMFGIKFAIVPSAHPVYSQMRNGIYYFLLCFLIDYALHIAPDPIDLCNRVPDGATLQDTYPPMRFINLLFHTAIELNFNTHGGKKSLTNESELYKAGSSILANCINDMHSQYRKKTGPVFKRLFGKKVEKTTLTFFSMEVTTNMWITKLAGCETAALFPDAWAVKDKALRLRLSNPNIWFNLSLFGFNSMVGMPLLIDSGIGLHFEPYLASKEELPEDELKKLLEISFNIYHRVMVNGEEWWSIPDPGLAPTLLPFRFIESVIARLAHQRFALTAFVGQQLCCPLTESIGRALPCKQKKYECKAIHYPYALPNNNCWLRGLVRKHFIEPDRFKEGR